MKIDPFKKPEPDALTVDMWDTAYRGIKADIERVMPIIKLLDAYHNIPTDNMFYEHNLLGTMGTTEDTVNTFIDGIRNCIVELAVRMNDWSHVSDYRITYAVADVGWSLNTSPTTGPEERLKHLSEAIERLDSLIIDARAPKAAKMEKIGTKSDD